MEDISRTEPCQGGSQGSDHEEEAMAEHCRSTRAFRQGGGPSQKRASIRARCFQQLPVLPSPRCRCSSARAARVELFIARLWLILKNSRSQCASR
eukprot:8504929-Pyramimonas_sp.AAC.1